MSGSVEGRQARLIWLNSAPAATEVGVEHVLGLHRASRSPSMLTPRPSL